jgi:DNA-binding response OmpR family regulator
VSERVLVAEDDRVLRRAVDVMLRKHGYQVSLAADGAEALVRAQQDKPDLILHDVILPKMLGFEVLRLLKASDETATIPVVMLSNLEQESDHREALDGGAIAFIIKSNIRLDKLAAEVDAIFASHIR